MASPPTQEMADATISGAAAPKGTFKRDALRTQEIAMQQLWNSKDAFEATPDDTKEGFLITFPYPYANGHLHIGHAFSLTKAIFRAQYERHQGKNVLFPFSFHCTGMPIQAAANKLKTELETYGCPPQFPEDDPEVRAKMEADLAAANAKKSLDKSKGGKTKLVQKTGTGIVRQYHILAKMVENDQIPQFVDPLHWLSFFPPIGVDHLKMLGVGVDWRRSFITTVVNPYYDAFIRWQFERLHQKGKILFGKRNNIYSLVDQQVCADHDRSQGEGVGPQEYVLIKQKVLPVEEADRHSKMKALQKTGKTVYLVPATLRPETMYGQTNCFVLPTGEYGAYDVLGELFIMSARSARGLSCQVHTTSSSKEPFAKEFGTLECLETFAGTELLGLPLQAPMATYDKVYVLPLLTISMGKGTGVVTSVPSDAPDDYVALKAMQDKPDYAAKYGIAEHMVAPFEVVPIISIEGYGDKSAVFMCEKLKIKSPNDTVKLQQAKDETYLKGFTLGVMQVGEHKGKKVSEAKPIIKQQMIDAGQACLYFEPESKVMSRTNDECVVAATDQWYLAYGDETWTQLVRNHVLNGDTFDAYDPQALSMYDFTTGWLKEWACTRQFGLGTFLPWDPTWVIESLSDSTIYMAFYTISHYLQGENNLNGDPAKSPSKVDPKDLTSDVFDYIFLKNAPQPKTNIPTTTLDQMRNEFRYWYPMAVRVSAKDLIPNHLTMCLFHHAAIWEDEPDIWPKSYYCNGHVLVDAEKMSKSKGNFLMMADTVELFSADATRLACANAGDSLDDANFARETADSSILSLSNEAEWIYEALTKVSDLRTGDLHFMDEILQNDTNRLIAACGNAFGRMQFRQGVAKGWFDMLLARNDYRSWCKDSGVTMHRDVITKWANSLLILLCPICPHWSESLWQKLGYDGLAVQAPWPTADKEDFLKTRQGQFLRDGLKRMRQQVGKAKKPFTHASIVVCDTYPSWKTDVLMWMQEQYTEDGFAQTFMKDLKGWCGTNVTDKKQIKATMQFAAFMKQETKDVGKAALDTELPYDQSTILQECMAYLKSQLVIEKLDVVASTKEGIPDRVKEQAAPGKPFLWLQ